MNAKDKWINGVENSLNGVKPAEADPYLYSKILNRLHSGKIEFAPPKLVWVTALSMIVLIFLNIVTLNNGKSNGKNDSAEIQVLAEQYQLTNNNILNYN